MLSDPIETPPSVADILARKSITLPLRTRSEVFSSGEGGVRCLVCTAPASRAGVQCIVIALMDVGERLRKSFVSALDEQIKRTRLKIPNVDVVNSGDSTVLLAPWVFRGELRALVASAVAELAGESDATMDTASRLFSPSIPDGDEALAMLNLSALKDELYKFVLAFDSSFRWRLRQLVKFADETTWSLALGCSVRERVKSTGASWEIRFVDLELFERAHLLVEARCDSGKVTRLKLSPPTIAQDHETQLPLLRLVAKDNSRGARIEMARLLQSVLVSLDRMNFRVSQNQVRAISV